MHTSRTSLVILCLFFLQVSRSQTYDVYVSDAGNFQDPPWKIWKYDENGMNPLAFISTGLAWPQDILFLEQKNEVLVSNLNSGRITRYDAGTGAYLSNFAIGIGGPTRMKIGPDNLLYVLQWSGNGKVWRYKLDGTFFDEFTSVGVPQSIGLDWDASGNLYVSSYTQKFIRKFSPTGQDLGLFVQSDLLGPTNIWFDATGDILVIDYNGTSVKRFGPDGQLKGDFINGLSQAEGVAMYPNGNRLIGNGFSHSVKLFGADGQYIKEFVTNGAGGLLTPNAVVLREQSPTSTFSPSVSPIKIIPTKGREFYIAPEDVPRLDSIHVYDGSGKVLSKGKVTSSILWNAAAAPAGIYTLWLIHTDGLTSSQVVIVHEP